ncbi:hypothetical protein MMAGJ_46820 [Mycolicibacterium mageritense]|uniref:Uncharacterized protein n=1 Tax=Mycolicibacterium mageritense TaxID=53462 RepID=A0ABM7HXS7_MYCME|nr:hypothetical protein MMAGJ_46820 [Mycolicibacterium mageritense]GJJ18536.1 hypothetical protein MTY414_22090 [Mycolicibacterium mageritense]
MLPSPFTGNARLHIVTFQPISRQTASANLVASESASDPATLVDKPGSATTPTVTVFTAVPTIVVLVLDAACVPIYPRPGRLKPALAAPPRKRFTGAWMGVRPRHA